MECPKRKRLHFSETETEIQQRKEPRKSDVALKSCHTPKAARNLRPPTSHLESGTQELKKRLINSCARIGRRLILRNMEFLVTGFSRKREKKLEDLIKKYGGTVLSDIPRPTNRGKRCKGFKPQAVPVVLCSKVQCVGKRFIAVGSSVEYNSHSPIFDNLGIMLHGEKNLSSGQVFKTLLELVRRL